MIRRSGELFIEKIKKVPHFAERHEKSSIWPKLATFSSTLPWFGVWVNFPAKNCKKCLISQESMKNRRFPHKLTLSRGNYHVSSSC